MCVRNTTALLVFLVGVVVPQPQKGLDQEEADDNGTEYCVCLARPFVELLSRLDQKLLTGECEPELT